MKSFSRIPLKSLAIVGAAMIVSSAFANSWSYCETPCTQAAQRARDQAAEWAGTTQSQYCASLTDASARNACFAAVPAYVQQTSQNAYSYTFSSCMSSCMATPGGA